jgi:hypothetical protein
VSNLPINVQGIGVAQLVAVYFFAPYFHSAAGLTDRAAGRPAVIAYSLATAGVSVLLQMLLGLVCLRWATARGLKPEPVEAVAEAAAG